jgi:hypothetical protein
MREHSIDVAHQMATAWNRTHGEREFADAVDYWPCCQILAAGGVIVGQEQNLAAVELGPFRIALTRRQHATRDFIEVLFPATVAAIPAGQPLLGAVSGALSAACLTFLKLLERSVVFSRSEVDVQRWIVLMYVKNRNAEGIYPTICEVVNAVARLTDWDIRADAVESSVEWLISNQSDDDEASSGVPLLRLNASDGGLESLA